MIETGNDDNGGLAAEYVLGTLDDTEKAQAEALLRGDTAFAAAVEQWRRRFDPMLAVAAVLPPPGILKGVFAALDRETPHGRETLPAGSEVIQLRRRAAFWKSTAAAAAALAASLALFLAIRPFSPTAPAYVAILESADRKEAFVASADLGTGGLHIRRVGLPPPPGKSYELWAIWEGAAPESLGVVGRNAFIPAKTLVEKTEGQPLAKILLAITEEREGGSINGKPGGAPVFSGKLIKAPAS